jgi:hypothetical protein
MNVSLYHPSDGGRAPRAGDTPKLHSWYGCHIALCLPGSKCHEALVFLLCSVPIALDSKSSAHMSTPWPPSAIGRAGGHL